MRWDMGKTGEPTRRVRRASVGDALACVMMRAGRRSTVVAVLVSIIFNIVIDIGVLKTQALQHTYTVWLYTGILQ